VLAPSRLRLAGRSVLQVSCANEPCTLRAVGSMRAGTRVRALAPVTRTLAAGKLSTVALRLSPALASARRALARGLTVRLRVVVSASDAAGNVARRAVSIRLRR
jgi:hypothetical protein